ncbi:hypothetical protein BD779DRAFT_1678169 [Infundibulicybe gibba]|nr:hypothetical protein BD779DRAFT_1678169 [Infundibulicybe gibba]
MSSSFTPYSYNAVSLRPAPSQFANPKLVQQVASTITTPKNLELACIPTAPAGCTAGDTNFLGERTLALLTSTAAEAWEQLPYNPETIPSHQPLNIHPILHPSQHITSPTPPPPEFDASSRRPSREDGEILNPIPSTPFPFKRPAYVPPSTSEEPSPFVRKQSTHIPYSHAPLTHPCSFHTLPSTSPSMHPRRPSNPAYRPPTLHIALPRRSSSTPTFK